MDKAGKQQIWGSLGLLTATLLWGFSFVVVKDSTESIPVLYLLALRYLIASVGMAVFLLCRKSLPAGIPLPVIKQGMVLGALLFVSQFFQTLGCKYTTAGKNAFITTIYVILVPFLYWWIEKRRPDRKCVAAAFIAILGIGLLSIRGDLTVQTGDFLTVICGAGLALHIIFVDKYTRKTDPVVLRPCSFSLQTSFPGSASWQGRYRFRCRYLNRGWPGKCCILESSVLWQGFFCRLYARNG